MASALRLSLSTAQRRLQLLIPKACNRLNSNPPWHAFTNLSPPLASHRKNSLLQLLRRYHQSTPRRKEVPPSVENTHALVADSKSPVLPPLPGPPVSSISGESSASPSFAFAFDIDGVLLHSRTVYPPAIPTLHHLQNTSVPFLLLTNGGGSLERIRADNLSKYLNLTSPPLSPSHIIQSHTPFKLIAAQQKLPASFDPYVPGGRELKNAVLVVGGPANGSCRSVAQEYGFRNVIIPEDIFLEWARDTTSGSSDTSKTVKPAGHEEGEGKGKISSSVWPYRRDNPNSLYKVAQPLPRLPDGSIMPIDAIFVFNDPRDWGRDIQIILDFILPAVESDSDSSSTIPSLQPPPPALVFSNPDLIWSSLHPTPRLGQGAFRAALEGTYRRVVEGTRPDLSPVMKYVCIGKPFQETYQYAEDELIKAVDSVNNGLKLSQEQEQRESKEQQDSEYEGNLSSQPKQNQSTLKTVYMLGDNPLSDIQGANAFNRNSTRGIEWVSILVESGVYKPGQDFPAGGKPRMIVKDVWEGVRWALKREGWV